MILSSVVPAKTVLLVDKFCLNSVIKAYGLVVQFGGLWITAPWTIIEYAIGDSRRKVGNFLNCFSNIYQH